ncbi:hypothetical protein N9N28_16035 [Rubripirellula amarantea]|nr:hypothetical protein [Rubripirellula amarantea]
MHAFPDGYLFRPHPVIPVVPRQRRPRISFSIKTLLLLVLLCAFGFGVRRYLNSPMSLEERIDDSFLAHSVIPDDEIHRSGAPILMAIAESTPESLATPTVIGAWIRESSNELVVIFLAEYFTINQLTLTLDDGTTETIDVPNTNIAYNQGVSTHAIDFRVTVPLTGLRHAVTSVAIVRDGVAQAPSFPVTKLAAQQDAEPRDGHGAADSAVTNG